MSTFKMAGHVDYSSDMILEGFVKMIGKRFQYSNGHGMEIDDTTRR